MIGIVFKPVKGAAVVHGENLYDAEFNQKERLFRVRARTAAEAERKFMVVCRHDLPNKTLDFNPKDWPLYDEPCEVQNRKPTKEKHNVKIL